MFPLLFSIVFPTQGLAARRGLAVALLGWCLCVSRPAHAAELPPPTPDNTFYVYAI